MDLYTLLGLAGAAGYIASYGLLQLGLLDGNGVRYSVANVVAACLMLVSLTDQFHLGAAIIQIIWVVIGVAGLMMRMLRRPPAQVSGEVVAMHTQTAAHEDVHAARDRVAAAASPFRAAASPVRAAYGLRPDRPQLAGQPTLGLRADVVASYENGRAG